MAFVYHAFWGTNTKCLRMVHASRPPFPRQTTVDGCSLSAAMADMIFSEVRW